MRVLIVGGTLFIGRALALRLRELGASVAVLRRGETPCDLPDDIARLVGDRDSLADAREDIAAFAPQVIVHNIVAHDAHVSAWLDATEGLDCRHVMTSSSDVYAVYGRSHGSEEGPVDHEPQDEDAPLRVVLHPYRSVAEDENDRRWHYDKIPAERLLLERREDAVVLRLPMVIGPRDPQHRLRALLDAMDRGRPHLVQDAGLADWHSIYGYVDNVADAMARVCLASALPQRIYNVGDAVLPMRELVLRVAAVARWDGDYVTPSSDQLPEALREDWHTEHWLTIDCGRLRRDLGWEPAVSLEDAFERTLAWEREVREPGVPDLAEREAAEDAWMAAREGA